MPRPAIGDDLVVMKFGGTSVGDAGALALAADMVARERGRRIVVVSALAGVTDALLALAGEAGRGGAGAMERRAARLLERHRQLAARLVPDAVARNALDAALVALVDDLGASCRRIARQGAATPADLDSVAAVGELLSSRLAAAVLASRGAETVWIDARQVVVTSERHTRAAVVPGLTRRRALGRIAPELAAGRVPVMGGFIGATASGATTTLGRGGSDSSAAVIGAALGAREVQIWTDVDGIYTADPRLVSEAQPIARLSFAEAHELARLGAKVLHPTAVEAAASAGVPLRILATREPDQPGTLVASGRRGAGGGVVGLACCHVVLVERPARRRRAPAAILRPALERHVAEPLFVGTARDVVTVAVPAAAWSEPLRAALDVGGVMTVHHGYSLLSAVCASRAGGRRVQRRLDGWPGLPQVRPLDGLSAMLVVPTAAAAETLRELHVELFERTDRAVVATAGVETSP